MDLWYIPCFESGYNPIGVRDMEIIVTFNVQKINTENLQNKKFTDHKKTHPLLECACFVSVILLRKRAV